MAVTIAQAYACSVGCSCKYEVGGLLGREVAAVAFPSYIRFSTRYEWVWL